jgi:hypothetical protein
MHRLPRICSRQLKRLGARSLTWSKVHTEEPTNIRNCRTKLSLPGDLTTGICAHLYTPIPKTFHRTSQTSLRTIIFESANSPWMKHSRLSWNPVHSIVVTVMFMYSIVVTVMFMYSIVVTVMFMYSYWQLCFVLYTLCQLAFSGYPDWGFYVLFPQL